MWGGEACGGQTFTALLAEQQADLLLCEKQLLHLVLLIALHHLRASILFLRFDLTGAN